MTPLGIRYNNPCNIRYNSANRWKGQSGQYKGFCKFTSVTYGLRACLYLLRKYRFQYGLDTPRKIISRFAPPSENDTELYIEKVVSVLHSSSVYFTSDYHLNFDFFLYSDASVLFLFLSAICQVETGFNLTRDDFILALKSLHDVH